MRQAQEAMARAQTLEQELALEKIMIEKGPVKAEFNGVGELLRLKIDPAAVDVNDLEMLEDLIVGAVRDGFNRSTEMRNERVQAIMPNIPGF